MFINTVIPTESRRGEWRNPLPGITALEILVSVGIFALLVGSIVGIFINSWKYNRIIWEQLSTQNEGRKVTQDFVNELRTASQSSIGGYPIAAATTSSITFYSNIDTDSYKERVRYFLSGNILKKGTLKPSGSPLSYNPVNEIVVDAAHDVTTGTITIFTYYDGNYSGFQAPLPSPIDVTKIRVVKISLRLEEDPNLTPAPFHIESEAMVRNLKDN